jgi:hypothetical protein
MTYADTLERAAIQRQFDSYFWQEIRQARVTEQIKDLAETIADDVLKPSRDNAHRRGEFVEELIDGESFQTFVRDLLDDVQAGVNPTDTIRRKVRNWALGVAEYEVERGEHD